MSINTRGWIPYKVGKEDIKETLKKIYKYNEPITDDIDKKEKGVLKNSGFIYYKKRMIFYSIENFEKGDAIELENGETIHSERNWTYIGLGADEEGQAIIKDLVKVFGGYYDYNDCESGVYTWIEPDNKSMSIIRYLEKKHKEEILKDAENLIKKATGREWELVYTQNEDNTDSKITMKKLDDNGEVVYMQEQGTSMDSEKAFFKEIVKLMEKARTDSELV